MAPCVQGPNPVRTYALLLKMQKEMASLQLQLSNLQDTVRTTDMVLQEVLKEAMSSLEQQ